MLPRRVRAGEKGRRIRELTSVVQKRFNFPPDSVELYAEKVNERGLCAIAQAESLRYKLLGGLAVRRWELLSAASTGHGGGAAWARAAGTAWLQFVRPAVPRAHCASYWADSIGVV